LALNSLTPSIFIPLEKLSTIIEDFFILIDANARWGEYQPIYFVLTFAQIASSSSEIFSKIFSYLCVTFELACTMEKTAPGKFSTFWSLILMNLVSEWGNYLNQLWLLVQLPLADNSSSHVPNTQLNHIH